MFETADVEAVPRAATRCVRRRRPRACAARHESAVLPTTGSRSPSLERGCGSDDRWGAAVWSRFGPSGPSAAKPIAMPSHHGVRLNDRQRRPPIRPDSGQDDPKQPVARPEVRALCPACHRRQLLPQRQIFQDQFLMAAQGQRHRAADHDEQFRHPLIVAGGRAKINVSPRWTSSGEGQRALLNRLERADELPSSWLREERRAESTRSPTGGRLLSRVASELDGHLR